MTASPAAASVIVPAFNVAEFLPTALARLGEQSTREIEIVVIDDASSDDSLAIARAAAEQDPRIVVIALEENAGVAAAREAGVRGASGEYVWFVDADDEWPDDAIERMLAAARSTGADVLCVQATTVLPDGTTKPVGSIRDGATSDAVTAYRRFLRGDISGHLWNKLFRRETLLGIEFTRSRQHSDQAMVAQAIAASRIVAEAAIPVYRYLLRSGSIIRSGSKRADSLRTVSAVVRSSAARLDPALLNQDDFLYYSARFDILSRMKDATSGAYAEDEARGLVREVRSAISLKILLSLARRRDSKRLILLSSAKVNPSFYRAIMKSEGARA